jgi:hypothetical protein
VTVGNSTSEQGRRTRLPPPEAGKIAAARPRVLHIIGFGRSGSTVLGIALGRHPAIFNVGEVVGIPSFLAGPNYVAPRACGCLNRIEQCPFWSEVGKRVPLGVDTLPPTAAGWRHYVPWLSPISSDLARWGASNARFFSAVLDVSGASIVVDASKRAERAYWLWASGAVDLIPLWLTRDFRAVMRSEQSRHRSRIKAAVSWWCAQRRAAQLAVLIEARGGKVIRGTYEEMTADPRTFFNRILTELGLDWCREVLNLQPGHVIGGDHNTKHGGRGTFVRPAATVCEREQRPASAFMSWRSLVRPKGRV